MNLNTNQARSLLQGIKEEATTASLTGALKGGRGVMAQLFNQCRQALIADGDRGLSALFPELSDEASVDEIGMTASLLLRYIAVPVEKAPRPAEEGGLART